jgi:hypothetical protein
LPVWRRLWVEDQRIGLIGLIERIGPISPIGSPHTGLMAQIAGLI